MESKAIEHKGEDIHNPSSIPQHLIYLYCFFKGPSSLSPQKGVDGANDTFVLSHKDLCALVSPVPAHEYSEEPMEQRLQNLEWLTPRAKRHEEIIRYAMKTHPVIPTRFGTIYVSDERVLEVLCNHYGEFCSHLNFISDKEEWGIKVYAEKNAGRRAIESSNKTISQLDKLISSTTSPGQAYLLRKKREDLYRQQSIDFLNNISDTIYQQILSWSIEGRRNKLLSRSSTGKESDMILNAAFLLNKQDVEAFIEKVDALAEQYNDDAFFAISGPWPCYNFCPNFDRGERKDP